jgi:FAS-associated factor 2
VKLPWHEGSYASALDLSKSSLRFLLVVLQSDEHDDTAAFNRNILLSGEVAGFIQQNDIILWGGSVQESEAYQVSTALGCTKFPFAALITHAPNTPPGASSQGMSVVARMAGVTTAQGFVQKMQAAVERYRPALERIRGERAARDFDRRMREEQESAYEQSLALDRQRAQERRAAEEAERRKVEEAEKARVEKEIRAGKREQWRKWRAGRIEAEPAEGARVSIRTAEGERIVRKFPKEARLEEVYAFVECMGVDAEGAEEPRDYKHEYGFRLCSMMPRKVYEPEVGTVGEVLWPSGNLVVESLEEDDDEEDGDDE